MNNLIERFTYDYSYIDSAGQGGGYIGSAARRQVEYRILAAPVCNLKTRVVEAGDDLVSESPSKPFDYTQPGQPIPTKRPGVGCWVRIKGGIDFDLVLALFGYSCDVKEVIAGRNPIEEFRQHPFLIKQINWDYTTLEDAEGKELKVPTDKAILIAYFLD